MDIRVVIPSRNLGSPNFYIGDMGGNPLQQERYGGVAPSGSEADNGESLMAMIRWNMTVPPTGGIRGDENLHIYET